MKITATNVYVGPSIYANFPVIRMVLDIGVLVDWPSVKCGREFTDGLQQVLPSLVEHGCSYREAGGFIRRLTEDEGTWMGHIMEHVALEIQNIAGSGVSFGRTRTTGETGMYNMVYAYKQRDVGIEAGHLALRLLMHLLPEHLQQQVDYPIDAAFNFESELEDFVHRAQRREFGPSTQSLVDAAVERDIPWLRLNDYSLVQFGHGRYQKRIQATVTSDTGTIATSLASDKEGTHSLLRDMGLPVPKQTMFSSEDEAVSAVNRMGFPVVIKPLDANHGRGISINLTTDDEVREAFHVAREQGRSRFVLAESFVTGYDHRMLVVNNELVAVAKRVPGHVVGDGKLTIAELIDIVNSDPRRGIGHEKVLTRLELDGQAKRLMQDAGYDENTVLKKNEEFFLRSTANLSTGGTAIDLTDVVHPDNREMAVRAVRALGLDIGGVDFITDDITHSYKDVGGAIVEVNAGPGFRMHVAPSEGEPRDVSGKVLDMLYPPGTPSRIPVAAITGTNGKTTTTRMLTHIMKTSGHIVGMTSTGGIQVDGRVTVKGDMTGPQSAKIVLRDPTIDFAVLETARGGILRAGLGYSECDVAACINVTADHMGLGGIETLEQLARVKETVVRIANNTAVLNADDKLCLKMADNTRAKHLCYITMDPTHGLVREHIRANGRAVVLEKGINGEMITIYDNGAHIPLLWTHLIPATIEGKAMHNVQNAMFAAAMAFSFDKDLDEIRNGLRTFDTSFFQSPGRTNVYNEHPFKVILDYAHNPAGFRAMAELAGRLDPVGRRTIVISVPGDRRDEDIRESCEACLPHFTHFVCKADLNRRGRGHDELPQLVRKYLLELGVDDANITVIAEEEAAVDHALNNAEEGDLLVITADDLTRTWKQIVNLNSDRGESKETIPGTKVFVQEKAKRFVLDQDEELIIDERGVRLASSEPEDAD
ncbi:MAG: cyanophycin synthetase [Gammaproteobacteria bacterium]|nr:cyanophycin synthetase [Gammaproteobacteria bacterium]MCP4979833.1 cyanophycin synthetase [Gammaproteobacteria bacterium]